jgi:ABC-2 type transport system permease protein
MIGAAIHKDIALLIRDRGALISLFVLPIIFTLTFGSLFQTGLPAGSPQNATWLAGPLASISSFQVAVPGNAVLFGFFISLTVAMAFASERRSGTWRRLLAAPVPRWQALLATLVPYLIVGVAQLAFLFTVGVVAFDMQIAGSVMALAGISVAVAFCAVGLGLLFAAVATTEKQLGAIGSVVLLVMGMVGGCMVPRIVMPPVMQTLSLGVPHGWALDAYYAVLVHPSTTLADVAPAIAALLAFGILFAGLGLARFRFEA